MLLVLPRSPVTAQALEEQNLFLIQNSQETEHALDELKQNFSKVKLAMDTKTQVDPALYMACSRTIAMHLEAYVSPLIVMEPHYTSFFTEASPPQHFAPPHCPPQHQ